jgi:hypothetical protein
MLRSLGARRETFSGLGRAGESACATRAFARARLLACLAIWIFFAAPVRAAMWPDQLGGYTLSSSKPAAVGETSLWKEYGLNAAEQAEYASGAKRFTATAFRLTDSTGAFAAFEWQRPADARASQLSELAVETAADALVAYGNYLLRFEGWKPSAEDLAVVLDRLPKLEKSPLPTLAGYLPEEHLVANSERYVIGPAALEKFFPAVPPSVAAFHMGAEAQIGKFRTPRGEMDLAIFSYPTPHIARDQLEAFHKVPGAIAKRSGSLVAVVLSPPDPDDAERLLAAVRHEVSVTLSERVPTQRDNIGDLILNIFVLIGIMLVFFTVAGVAYGGLRTFARRLLGRPDEADPMILLHLGDR